MLVWIHSDATETRSWPCQLITCSGYKDNQGLWHKNERISKLELEKLAKKVHQLQ